MSVPARRKSRSSVRRRRSHHALTALNIQTCAACGNETLPHRVCKHCGAYGDKRQVVDTSRDAMRAARRIQARKDRQLPAAEDATKEASEQPSSDT